MASTALYGVLAIPVCVLALGQRPSSILDAAGQRDGISGWFCAYMAVSLVAYPLVKALHMLMIAIGNKIGSSRHISPLGILPRSFYADLTCPFTSLMSPVGARHSIQGGGLYDVWQWFSVIVFFGWSVALWLWLAVGLITVAR